MKKNLIREYMDNGNTLLGIGPMSVNCTDAAIETANEYDIPVMLIASRRQIDDKNISRGYVNNWSTEEFAKYVREHLKNGNIILARDHGGPWQNNTEIKKKMSLKDAMESAKYSYIKDMEAGFDILHIDPSIDIFQQLSFSNIIDRLFELYEFCCSNTQNKELEFEIGTEEQMIHTNSYEEFKRMLSEIENECIQRKLKKPMFVVSQIGTKVMETKNIGILNNPDNEKLKKEIKELCNCAKENDIYIKAHNTDYLSSEILKSFPKLGINAANVAPEFGVCETKSFINLLRERKLDYLVNDFLNLSLESGKWYKWVIDSSILSDEDKAIIAGHYIFSTPEFTEIKDSAQNKIKDVNIDNYLKEAVKNNILKYYKNFTLKPLSEYRKKCLV